jgi:hypothetical protein
MNRLGIALAAAGVAAALGFASGAWAESEQAASWKARLNLDDEQTQKLASAFKDRDAQLADLNKRFSDELQKLQDLLKKKAAEKELDSSLDRLEATRQAIFEEGEKFRNGAATYLSSAQRARLTVLDATAWYYPKLSKSPFAADWENKGKGGASGSGSGGSGGQGKRRRGGR